MDLNTRNLLRKILIAITLVMACTHLNAQQGFYPDQFSSYYLNPSIINPAFFSDSGSFEALIQNKLRRGQYKDISTFSATIQKTFNRNGNNWHSGRLTFQNEKEGPYISIPRAYGTYGVKVQIKKNTSILVGTSVGFINPNFSTPTKTINTNLFDGSVGVILKYKKKSLGISSNQIFGTLLNSNNSIKLKQFYTTNYDDNFMLNENLDLNTRLLCSFYPDIPSLFNVSTSLLFRKTLEGGLGYKSKHGIFFSFTVIANKQTNHPIKISTIYNSNIFNKQNSISESVEIILAYCY